MRVGLSHLLFANRHIKQEQVAINRLRARSLSVAKLTAKRIGTVKWSINHEEDTSGTNSRSAFQHCCS